MYIENQIPLGFISEPLMQLLTQSNRRKICSSLNRKTKSNLDRRAKNAIIYCPNLYICEENNNIKFNFLYYAEGLGYSQIFP